MNNEASLANYAGKEEKTTNTEQNAELTESTELSEDMVMVSPGTMLREARKTLSMSKEHIASKLNLTLSIINNIENDTLDPLIPVTFNRGYLTNYARLVGIDASDVLVSYQALDAATVQRSEMLSFSKETTKQAEHSRVMWLSYFIVAVLVGLTILWWQQESREQVDDSSIVTSSITQGEDLADNLADNSSNIASMTATPDMSDDSELDSSILDEEQMLDIEEEPLTSNVIGENLADNSAINTLPLVNTDSQSPAPVISTAVFTFNGDCWVNIFDATGERIAWGVKKSGYVMTIQGEAPLSITIGKPELTSIIFDGQPVDMSTFETGNIAKFDLPIIE